MSNEAWPRGSMVFEFRDPPGYIDKKYVSKKGEPPSEFLARILKDRVKKGAIIFPYLKIQMEG